MVKIGLIGFGYWGPNLVRNFSNQTNGSVTIVAESRIERHAQINKLYPSITVCKNASDLINNINIDAIVIATPVFSRTPAGRRNAGRSS